MVNNTNPGFTKSRVCFFVGSSLDITDRKILENKLEASANFDSLTKLPNRRLFVEEVAQIILEHEREKKKFALLFIDLDDFKSINDIYGHDVGDKVLKETPSRFLLIIRKSDLVARIGGDEFTIILRNIHLRELIVEIIEKIQFKIKQAINSNGFKCKVGSSIGVAIYPQDGRNFDTLVKNSDEAMYEIKNNAKGGYSFK